MLKNKQKVMVNTLIGVSEATVTAIHPMSGCNDIVVGDLDGEPIFILAEWDGDYRVASENESSHLLDKLIERK